MCILCVRMGGLLGCRSRRTVVLELVQLERQQGRDPAQCWWAAAGPEWLSEGARRVGCIWESG
jgi:hypothetical protein